MSRYLNAAEILPAKLLQALQRYAEGTQLYIPRRDERVGWGERSGTRAALAQRNRQIMERRLAGASIEELMAEFHLSYDSIRKILNSKRRQTGGKNGSTGSGA